MFRQAGFSVLTLLIIAATLLGAMAYVITGAGPNVQGQVNSQRAAQLVAQGQLIVHRIVKCATDYPLGNGVSVYPVGVGVAAGTLTCPGNNDQNLWSGVDGVYYPASITGFGGWTYTKASPTTISITASDPTAYSASIAVAATKVGASATATANTLTVKIIE